MANSVSDAIRVSKLLGFDYTKFENTKLAAEKRKSSGDTNKMRNKKILVNPVRAYRKSVDHSNLNIEGEEVTAKSGRRSVPSDKLHTSKLLKRCSSETKEIKAKISDADKSLTKSISDKVANTRSPLIETSLKEVRKKLDFKDEIDDDLAPLQKGLDFTDKIAALRSLMRRDRETREITDRKAYYDEYQSQHRKVMVSRSDSTKENHNGEINVKSHQPVLNGKHRRIHSADIFKERQSDGRLSAVDLHLLKEKLEDRKSKKTEIDDVIEEGNSNNNAKKESKSAKSDNSPENDNALNHIKKGRKVLVARTRQIDVKTDINEAMETDCRSSSRIDCKETQANVLNQSIRSVQSNAPFYEPMGRPSSAPLFQCGIKVGKKRVEANMNNDFDGIESGVKTEFVKSGSSKEDRQTNLGNFDSRARNGTPERDNRRQRVRPASATPLHVNNDIDADVAKRRPVRPGSAAEQRLDEGNQRPSSRNGRYNDDRKTPDVLCSSNKLRRSSENLLRNNIDEFRPEVNENHVDKRMLKSTEKSERKVREWIKNQEILRNGRIHDSRHQDSGPMVMEELNISISIPACSNMANNRSPNNNCDSLGMKHKPKRSKAQPLNSTPAYGFIHAKDGYADVPYDSKAIFDKLEHITMAVHTQQHQLEVEIPMKDVKIRSDSNRASESKARKSSHVEKRDEPDRSSPIRQRGRSTPVHQYDQSSPVHLPDRSTPVRLVDSDSTSNESSVFSLPFSLRSGDSVSSTCQAVKLLRKLYNVEDSDTRQDLVLLAKCFRRWFNNVLHAKARNLQILQAAKRYSPISYGVMIRKGDVCYKTNVLSYYFNHWRTSARNNQLLNKVASLHRRHTLKKGMNAFRWAINRSKVQQGILQDRVNNMLQQSIFNKWKCRALENRRLRLQQAFFRWRQFTKEAQKIRMLRNQTNLRLKEKIFLEWHDAYIACMKQHKADRHARRNILIQSWTSWRSYTTLSKDKKQRQDVAVQLFKIKLQRKMFTCWTVEYSKYTVAKQFHKVRQLKVAMAAWKIGTKLSKTEREDDHRVATVYWSRSSLRTYFTAWRDTLLNNKACRKYDHNMVRDTFYVWKNRYIQLIERRQAVDTYIRNKVQTRTFQHWYTFVVIMKQRRAAAVECLQSVLQRRMFERWRSYTVYRKNLRRRLILHSRKNNLDTERRYLSIWRDHFKVKCDEKKAQQLWSNSCAKKAAERWILVCHRRRLARLLIDTEPYRQLNRQRVYYLRWKTRFDMITEEKQAASDVRSVLDTSQLKLYYDKWLNATKQLLTIKPMVQRYKKQLVTRYFHDWRHYVVHKAECLKSEQALILFRLKNKFNTWKRQYAIQQIQKEHSKKIVNRQAKNSLQAWYSVIQRKHKAQQFRNKHLVKSTFYHWNTLALRQVREKRLHKVEMEAYMSTLREYFDRWKRCLYNQQSQDEERTLYLQQLTETNQVKLAFTFWRRHFRATLVARENEKIRVRKLAKQALQAWHEHTQTYLQDAVEKFGAAIGIHQGEAEDWNDHDQQEIDGHIGSDKYDEPIQCLERGDTMEGFNTELSSSTPKSPLTPRTPRTPRTPKPISAIGTPLRKLYSPSLSHHSLIQSLEFDSPGAIMSSSFLDARFEMEHAVKTANRREIVITAVTRLRHWPVSILFEQWKDYTSRQRELKHLSTQMINVQQELVTKRFFNSWLHSYRCMKLAKQHHEQVLQHKALLSLILYRNSRLQKKHMNNIACSHYARHVYTSIFPVWLAKAQDKQKSERIVHLWTNITDEERELIPRERSYKYKLNKKILHECFTVWKNKYKRLNKLKKVYHNILYQRYFTTWYTWATEQHKRNKLCEQFRDNRRKKLVWKTWCLRHTQKVEVEKRFETAWDNYQLMVLQTWQQWARDQRTRKLKAAYLIQCRERHLVVNMLTVWKDETRKQTRVKQWHHEKLMARVLIEWRYVASWQKDLKQKQSQCQLMSYTCLAKRAFKQWLSCYNDRLVLQEHHERIIQNRVLRIATCWRRKCQKTRSVKLKQQFQLQHMRGVFQKWRAAYDKNLQRYDQLEEYMSHKHSQLTFKCLETWRTELMCVQANRVFTMKLMATLLSGWKLAAKGCHERRNALQKYTEHKNFQSQRVHFLYWYNVAKARKSIRGHANLKMQLTVFKAWLLYTRKKINLRRLETNFTRARNLRIVKNHWYLVKTRFDYCVELSEMANGVIHEKNRTLMRQALQHWDFRLKIVIADECHEHILAKRTANRWHRFVVKKRQERQYMKEQMEKAEKYYNKQLCNKVYCAWFKEVLATRHNEKRKQKLCSKYALIWKHRVDMSYTAKCIRNEKLYTQVWKIWHLEFVKRMAIKKVEAIEKKQQLTMVFVSWKNLVRKRNRRISSLIPLPISPAHNMPTAPSVSSSGSSTPTDELNPPYSPTINKHSQLPLPVVKRKKSLSARNSPTGSMEVLTQFRSGRRGSIY
ncbi:hypothetical protein ACF0H5_019833 [Mactra antiquata]